jgi:hypothetical protein
MGHQNRPLRASVRNSITSPRAPTGLGVGKTIHVVRSCQSLGSLPCHVVRTLLFFDPAPPRQSVSSSHTHHKKEKKKKEKKTFRRRLCSPPPRPTLPIPGPISITKRHGTLAGQREKKKKKRVGWWWWWRQVTRIKNHPFPLPEQNNQHPIPFLAQTCSAWPPAGNRFRPIFPGLCFHTSPLQPRSQIDTAQVPTRACSISP